MNKRGFRTHEALHYLGVGRRFFDAQLRPLLRDKGVRAGTSVIYEKEDLDSAWDAYKERELDRQARHQATIEKTPQAPLKKTPAPSNAARRKTESRPPKASDKPDQESFASVVSRIIGKTKDPGDS